MWLITKEGFYSVVDNKEVKDCLTVRSRAEDDLIALKRFYPDLEVHKSEKFRDYPYRAYIPRELWIDIVTMLLEEINYHNFKDAIASQDGERAHIYSGVWAQLIEIEEDNQVDEKFWPWL